MNICNSIIFIGFLENKLLLLDYNQESDLFGYEGGDFTGSRREGNIGKFEYAHKGGYLYEKEFKNSRFFVTRFTYVNCMWKNAESSNHSTG
ncbi:sigma 54-interacting transcriptional regulator [Bacillus sp. UNC41MFS5]|uniref:sigma 54-interacting transcriptional regulator n=1 Tax=Bacillus sp. UNC41MFS5 TaxID=1449046 RepID=UPI0009DF43FE|nr:sigma 54-interacting transcriptional regulator [Bacillus sp. UNC41MFS5]